MFPTHRESACLLSSLRRRANSQMTVASMPPVSSPKPVALHLRTEHVLTLRTLPVSGAQKTPIAYTFFRGHMTHPPDEFVPTAEQTVMVPAVVRG
jgi:hypothetical protein